MVHNGVCITSGHSDAPAAAIIPPWHATSNGGCLHPAHQDARAGKGGGEAVRLMTIELQPLRQQRVRRGRNTSSGGGQEAAAAGWCVVVAGPRLRCPMRRVMPTLSATPLSSTAACRNDTTGSSSSTAGRRAPGRRPRSASEERRSSAPSVAARGGGARAPRQHCRRTKRVQAERLRRQRQHVPRLPACARVPSSAVVAAPDPSSRGQAAAVPGPGGGAAAAGLRGGRATGSGRWGGVGRGGGVGGRRAPQLHVVRQRVSPDEGHPAVPQLQERLTAGRLRDQGPGAARGGGCSGA